MIEWSVTVPERGQALGRKATLGTVRLNPGTEQEETLSVPRAVALRLKKLQKTGEVSAESRAELIYRIKQVSLSCASAKVERLINAREYSEHEVREKLARDGYWPQVIDDVVGRAVEGHLIQDSRFADAFIRTKISSGWGRSRIERELKRRGVDPETVPGWPDEYLDADSEAERAFEIASRRRPTGKNDFQKLVRFLCTRGFSMGVAYDAARRVMASWEEDDA